MEICGKPLCWGYKHQTEELKISWIPSMRFTYKPFESILFCNTRSTISNSTFRGWRVVFHFIIDIKIQMVLYTLSNSRHFFIQATHFQSRFSNILGSTLLSWKLNHVSLFRFSYFHLRICYHRQDWQLRLMNQKIRTMWEKFRSQGVHSYETKLKIAV